MQHELEVRRSALFAPTPVIGRAEQAVCRRSPLCRDCHYAGHGFICWHRDGSCLRNDLEKKKMGGST